MSIAIESTAATPTVRSAPGIKLVRAAPRLWRVVATGGRVIGHLREVSAPSGVRYRAERFHAATRVFRALGEFWSPDDAVDCLRFAR